MAIDEETLLIDGETRVKDWPNCPTADCQFKVCLWAGLGLCAQCSEQVFGKAEMARRYEQTHPAAGGG